MANETTSTTWSKVTLSESLRGVVMAHTADKIVMRNLMNFDSIDGVPSLSADYPVYTDLGPLSAGSEGTDISANIEMALGTTVTLTPTEGAAGKATITTRAMRRRIPGYQGSSLYEDLAQKDLALVTNALRPEAMRLMLAAREKVEGDCVALLASLSNTVGTSGSDLSIADLLTAQYQMRTQSPHHRDWAYTLTANQFLEAQTAFGGASGTAASVWFQQGNVDFLNLNPDASRVGYEGTVMGIPIYVFESAHNQTANAGADVVGGLICVGRGSPESGQQGAFAYVEGEPVRYFIDSDESARQGELGIIAEYAAGVLDDNAGVGIVTDAPA